MKLDVLTDLLTKHLGARPHGTAFVVPAEVELTLFVDGAGDTFTVPRVNRLEVVDSLLIADASRGERYAFSWELVRAIKAECSESGGRERGAGFGK